MIRISLLLIFSTLCLSQTEIIFKDNMIVPNDRENEISTIKVFKEINDLVAQKYDLSGSYVEFSGKIIRISRNNVSGLTWMNIRDKYSSSVIVSTPENITYKAGDIVKVRGVLDIDIDLGQGYFFPVLIRDAKVEKIR